MSSHFSDSAWITCRHLCQPLQLGRHTALTVAHLELELESKNLEKRKNNIEGLLWAAKCPQTPEAIGHHAETFPSVGTSTSRELGCCISLYIISIFPTGVPGCMLPPWWKYLTIITYYVSHCAQLSSAFWSPRELELHLPSKYSRDTFQQPNPRCTQPCGNI